MKQSIKRLCLLLALGMLAVLTGCGAKSTPPPPSGGVDYNQYLNSPGYYACTDSAWYVCADTQIYFLDAELKSPLLPLCSKADCNHSDRESCSSYLPSGAYSIFGWNNTLYYLASSVENTGLSLYQMGLDGQNRKELATYFANVEGYSYMANVGGGYLSVALTEFTVNGDVTTLYLISLENPQDEPKELFTNREEASTSSVNLDEIQKPFVMHVSENWVFYDIQSGPADNRTNALYGYEIENGETKMLVEDGFSVAGDLSPVENTLYWYDTDGATYGTLNRIDLESGEIATVCEIPVSESVWGGMDDQYLYLSGGTDSETAELVIYDFEGNELQRLSCAELGTPLGYAFSSEDKVFFHSSALGEHDPICWVDLDKLEQGKAEFHLIEQ